MENTNIPSPIEQSKVEIVIFKEVETVPQLVLKSLYAKVKGELI